MDGNLVSSNLFSDDLIGSILITNNFDDNLTYFINDDLNSNIIFGQLNKKI